MIKYDSIVIRQQRSDQPKLCSLLTTKKSDHHGDQQWATADDIHKKY